MKSTTKSEGSDIKQHEFILTHFSRPTYCNLCTGFIWGLLKQGYECKFCHYSIHKKCIINAPAACLSSGDMDKAMQELEELKKKLSDTERERLKSQAELTVLKANYTAKDSSNAPPSSEKDTSADEDDEKGQCVICFENPKDTVLLECAHRCVCSVCSSLIKECPICRQPIVRVVRLFDA